MEILGQEFLIGSPLGMYSFVFIIILFILYFFKPKPYKKVLPSLIFLESNRKKMSITFFLKRFIKDWLFLLQLLIMLLICLSLLNIQAQLWINSKSQDVVVILDASASSKAKQDGKVLFDTYKNIARTKLGVTNSVILAKSTPEVLAKQTNPVNALRLITTAKPTDSLSNLWDAIMLGSTIGKEKSTIVLISDMIDTNHRDITLAKKILEARGHKIELINSKEKELKNIGIIHLDIQGSTGIIDIKNFNKEDKEVLLKNTGENILISSGSVETFSLDLAEGLNSISLETWDDFSPDDEINIVMPRRSETSVLFITDEDKSYIRSAFESITGIDVITETSSETEIGEHRIYVIDNLNFADLSDEKINKIKLQIEKGATLIIAAQKNLSTDKLGNLFPLKNTEELGLEIKPSNTEKIEKFKPYDFGVSSYYIKGEIKDNRTIVLAESNDNQLSPMITFSEFGLGHVFYYGIYDERNQFKISTQYPLFWISVLELLEERDSIWDLNLKVGEIIYGDLIETPSGNKYEKYAVVEESGIYKIKEKEVAVNLLNTVESDINKLNLKELKDESVGRKIKHDVELFPFMITAVILLMLLEVYMLKKRGDI